MLGELVRETRLKRGLTQAKLARLAGVSRRHLAALEKGANVSVLVLKKVAAVLDLHEIDLGGLSIRPSGGGKNSINVALLGETIREAREESFRAEGILSGASQPAAATPAPRPERGMTSRFPKAPVRRFNPKLDAASDAIHERPEFLEIRTSGVISQGTRVDESATELVTLPASVIELGELVFRVRGQEARNVGIEDGDLLIVQLRQKGRAANAELVVGRIGDITYVGRWWQKHGAKALMSGDMAEITVGHSKRSLKVVAAINHIIRPE
jgi:transcriptional regulator with XRE-family HTH domain